MAADDFARHFSRIIWPQLESKARYAGTMIALGYAEWSDSYNSLIHFALSRGAGHLEKFAEMEDRIEFLLLASVTEADRLVEEYRKNFAKSPMKLWKWVYRQVWAKRR